MNIAFVIYISEQWA